MARSTRSQARVNMAAFTPDALMTQLLRTLGYDFTTNPNHPVFLSLHNGGYLRASDLFNLNEQETSRLTFIDNTTPGNPITCTLNRGYQVRLLALQSFWMVFEHTNQRPMTDTDWGRGVTEAQMDEFIMRGHVLINPTQPVHQMANAQSSASRSNTAIDAFRKTIRRDPAHFTVFSDRNEWASWQLAFEATARAQDLQDLLNPTYVPSTSDERDVFDAKQQYMFSVFVRTLLTDEGKTLVRRHMANYNAQLIYKELKEYHNKSIHSEIKGSSILNFLSSFRLNGTNWAGGDTVSFLNYYVEQMRRYDEISLSANAPVLHDLHKIQLLDAAVQGIEDLRQVRIMYNTVCLHHQQHGTFENFYDLLYKAATTHDEQNAQSRRNARPSSRDRRVYSAQATYEDERYDSYSDTYDYYDYPPENFSDGPEFLDVDIDTPLSTINIFAAQQQRRPMGSSPNPRPVDPTTRLPENTFQQLSRDDKYAWFKLSPDGRRLILGNSNRHTTGGPPRPDARPSSGISSVDRRVLHVATTSPPTSDDLATATDDRSTPPSTEPSSTLPPMAQAPFPGDLRRVMSSSAARHAQNSYSINKTLTYTLAKTHVNSAPFGALIDRGANGGLAGGDCRILASNPDSFVNIEGIDRHQMTNIPVVSCGAYAVTKNYGPVILIFHQMAGVQKGPTILSAAQMEFYFNTVNERSLRFDPKGQLITTNDGFELPLHIRNGLAYLDLRPFTDSEWETLPHVTIMTSDVAWDPSVVDVEFPMNGDEHLATTADYDNKTPFDTFGNYRLGTIVASSHVLRDHPVLVETVLPDDGVGLNDEAL